MLSHQEVILRLLAAASLGAAIGVERERLSWVAGLRTHMLVCIGSALVMIVSTYGFDEVISAYRVVLDPSRIAAQVISGIGFLGAGTILFLRQQVIRGLTTAASLWAVAAIGLSAGSGLYFAAIATTVLVLVVLVIIKPAERRLFKRKRSRRLTVTYRKAETGVFALESRIEAAGFSIDKMTLRPGEVPELATLTFVFLRPASMPQLHALMETLQRLEGVERIMLGEGTTD